MKNPTFLILPPQHSVNIFEEMTQITAGIHKTTLPDGRALSAFAPFAPDAFIRKHLDLACTGHAVGPRPRRIAKRSGHLRLITAGAPDDHIGIGGGGKFKYTGQQDGEVALKTQLDRLEELLGVELKESP